MFGFEHSAENVSRRDFREAGEKGRETSGDDDVTVRGEAFQDQIGASCEEQEESSWTPYVSAKEACANKAGFAGGVAWKLSEIVRKTPSRANALKMSFSNVSEIKAALLCAYLRALGIRARLCA